MIQATVAVYPFEQPSTEAIERAIVALRNSHVEIEGRPMHTEIRGPTDAVFRALRTAYEAAADVGGVVLAATISNACPSAEARATEDLTARTRSEPLSGETAPPKLEAFAIQVPPESKRRICR